MFSINDLYLTIYLVATHWIDVCPANNNLLATTGSDKQVKIYDRREAKIVKIIETGHSGTIRK